MWDISHQLLVVKFPNFTERKFLRPAKVQRNDVTLEISKSLKSTDVKLSQKVNVLVILVTLVFELTILIDFKL